MHVSTCRVVGFGDCIIVGFGDITVVIGDINQRYQPDIGFQCMDVVRVRFVVSI